MGKGAIPDRWLDYLPIGRRIEGTRFIAFKVPLRKIINQTVAEEQKLDVDLLLEQVPNLGMIIDLTNTFRYYSPKDFTDAGVEYQKLMIPGHETPTSHMANKFKLLVTNFLNHNNDNDKLIGVHCTHGVNRTGYLICNYLISKMQMPPAVAIKSFNKARGHKIERENYLSALNQMDNANDEQQPPRRAMEQHRLRPDYNSDGREQQQQQRHSRKRHKSELRNDWRSSAGQSWNNDNERRRANYDGPTSEKQRRYADHNSHTKNEYSRQYDGNRPYNNSQRSYHNERTQHSQQRHRSREGNYAQNDNQNFRQSSRNWRQTDDERSQGPSTKRSFSRDSSRRWREQPQQHRDESGYRNERYSWRRQDT